MQQEDEHGDGDVWDEHADYEANDPVVAFGLDTLWRHGRFAAWVECVQALHIIFGEACARRVLHERVHDGHLFGQRVGAHDVVKRSTADVCAHCGRQLQVHRVERIGVLESKDVSPFVGQSGFEVVAFGTRDIDVHVENRQEDEDEGA